MKKRSCFLITATLLLFGIAFSCASDGTREKESEDLEAVTGSVFAGTLSMKGSEPHTYLALTTEEGIEYKITGPLEKKLAGAYQYKKVTVAGKIVKEAVGPGFPAELNVSEILKGDSGGE